MVSGATMPLAGSFAGWGVMTLVGEPLLLSRSAGRRTGGPVLAPRARGAEAQPTASPTSVQPKRQIVNERSALKTRFALTVVVRLTAGSGLAQTATYIGPNTGNADKWNLTASGDTGPVPSGADNVVIPAGKLATAWRQSTPPYTGNLTLEAGAQVGIGWTTALLLSYNALGTPGATTIFMHEGSLINMRMGGSPGIPAIELLGNGSWCLSSSTQPSSTPTFGPGISGAYVFALYCGSDVKLGPDHKETQS